MHTVRCPACRGDVGVDPADYGHPVACPLCGDVFTPTGNPPPRPAAAPEEDRPDRHRSEADDRDGPRRRRRQRSDAEVAAEAVLWPANGLIWTGIICAILSVIGGILFAGLGLAEMNNPNNGDEDLIVHVAVGAAAAGIGLPYFLVMAAGGRQLKRLDGGTGLVYTAAIMGFTTVFLCGVCSPTTWAAVTFGIWAIVAVNKPEVRAVLEAARGE